VPREILDLVVRFEQQLDAYKSGQYNETQLRREFLDPFFKALGWGWRMFALLVWREKIARRCCADSDIKRGSVSWPRKDSADGRFGELRVGDLLKGCL
jgi:hypothetical protein